MQTFLPFADFQKSAECLDYRRLGKQRVECFQLINSIIDPSYGWKSHPISKMWANNVGALIEYGIIITKEWKKRGYNDSMLPRFLELEKQYNDKTMPIWFGNIEFHSSHRANLLRKDESYYGQFKWTENPESPYLWFNYDSNLWYTVKSK